MMTPEPLYRMMVIDLLKSTNALSLPYSVFLLHF